MNELRPSRLDDLIGMTDVVKCLRISCDAAKKRDVTLGHTLLEGPPGTGKTTLANAIANEMGSKLLLSNGAELRTLKAVMPYVGRLQAGTIWFIDEIHRCTKLVQEWLYPLVEDYIATIGKGEDVQRIQVSPFTLIGATTDGGMLEQPMIDRFQVKHHLKVYEDDELAELVKINADKLSVSLDETGCMEVAKRGRGTPRITNNLLCWLRDWSIAEDRPSLTKDAISEAMMLIGVDEDGLTKNDRKYLKALEIWNSPAGIRTLVSLTDISQDTIESNIEPFLLRKGLIVKTSKGRILK